MRGDIDVPLTAEILKESRHQIQRRGLFHSYVLKVSHCAPCIPSVSLCPSCVILCACHSGRKTRSAILYFLWEAGAFRVKTVRLSAGGWNLPLLLLSPSLSSSAVDRLMIEGSFYEPGDFLLLAELGSRAGVDAPFRSVLVLAASHNCSHINRLWH